MNPDIAFFVFPGFQMLDLAGPLAAFQLAGGYRLGVLSAHGGMVASSSGVAVATARARPGADTLLITGGQGVYDAAASAPTVRLVRRLADKARRTASVCTGAFLLAATGRLDGRRATTHWRQAARLQAAHPEIRVEPDRIHLCDGAMWSSAGISAGIDLALALIEADRGAAAAKAVAQEMVVYYRRPAGQSQFSALAALDAEAPAVERSLHFARTHLRERLTVEQLAAAAHLSPRQFARVFIAATGRTPAKAVERLRLETARPLVEDGRRPLAVIAAATGFADPERMRQAFIRAFGQPPQALRRAARSGISRGARRSRRCLPAG